MENFTKRNERQNKILYNIVYDAALGRKYCTIQDIADLESLNLKGLKLVCDIITIYKLENLNVPGNVIHSVISILKKHANSPYWQIINNSKCYGPCSSFFTVTDEKFVDNLLICIIRALRIACEKPNFNYKLLSKFFIKTLFRKNQLITHTNSSHSFICSYEIMTALYNLEKRGLKTSIKKEELVSEIRRYSRVLHWDYYTTICLKVLHLKDRKKLGGLSIKEMVNFSDGLKFTFLEYYIRNLINKKRYGDKYTVIRTTEKIKVKARRVPVEKVYIQLEYAKLVSALLRNVIHHRDIWSKVARLCYKNHRMQHQLYKNMVTKQLYTIIRDEFKNEIFEVVSLKMIVSVSSRCISAQRLFGSNKLAAKLLDFINTKSRLYEYDRAFICALKVVYTLTKKKSIKKTLLKSHISIESLFSLMDNIQFGYDSLTKSSYMDERQRLGAEGLILKIMANLVINDPKEKKAFIHHHGILKYHKLLKKESLFTQSLRFVTCLVQDTPWSIKKPIVEKLERSYFLPSTSIKILKEQFNLLRNLLCCSKIGLDYINLNIFSFEEIFVFFNLFAKRYVNVERFNKTMVHLLFIMINITTHDISNKRLVSKKENIFSIANLCFNAKDKKNKIKSAVLWLMINLTWEPDDYFIKILHHLEIAGLISWVKDNTFEDKEMEERRRSILNNIEQGIKSYKNRNNRIKNQI